MRRSLVPGASSQLRPLNYQASPSGLPGIPREIAAHTSRFFFTAALWPSLGPEHIYTCGIISPQEDRWIKGLHGFRQLSKKFQGPRNPEQERGCGLWLWVGTSLWKPEILLFWRGTQPEKDWNKVLSSAGSRVGGPP